MGSHLGGSGVFAVPLVGVVLEQEGGRVNNMGQRVVTSRRRNLTAKKNLVMLETVKVGNNFADQWIMTVIKYQYFDDDQ